MNVRNAFDTKRGSEIAKQLQRDKEKGASVPSLASMIVIPPRSQDEWARVQKMKRKAI